MVIECNILVKALHMIKKIIDIEKFDYIKFFTDADDKLPDDITFKNVVMLITCVIIDGDKSYPQLFLEYVLVA